MYNLFLNFRSSIKTLHFLMQSEESFIPKKITIINQLTRSSVQCRINVPYLPSSREINFSRALSQIHSTVTDLRNSQIFYFDVFRRMNVFVGQYPFHEEILLKNQLFPENRIQMNYRKIGSDSIAPEKPCPPEQKKKKVKERTIKQAMNAVTQWRELYQITDQKGKRLYTLQTAAQKVGYAKKTLDDYFNQLRMAQYYKFDFSKHQFDKIGVLRRFVRACQKKQAQRASMMLNQQDEVKKMKDHEDIYQYFKDPSSSDEDQFNF